MSSWAAVAAAAVPRVEREQKAIDLSSGKLKVCVADATALIKGFSLGRMCDAVVTVQEVLNEVRDKNARSWLDSLPYEIHVLKPNAESVKTVVQFARETGDLPFLSLTDVQLSALSYELEKSVYGSDHLHLTPMITAERRSGTTVHNVELPGWGTVKNPEDWEAIDRLNEAEAESEHLPLEVSKIRPEQSLMDAIEQMKHLEITEALEHDVTCDDEECQEADEFKETVSQRTDAGKQSEDIGDSTALTESVDKSLAKPNQEEEGWQHVTKKDKKKKTQRPQREREESRDTQTGHTSCISCLTGDFGIQNVLLQMGLKVVTPDGVRICHLLKFGRKCASCFKVTRKSESVFCDNCGNATLYKVRIEIDDNGMRVIGGMANPPQRRGAKCTIPPPKGGKKNQDAILSQDILQQAVRRYQNMKTPLHPDILAPEYNEDSWFKMRVIKDEIKDQLPGRLGYPKSMTRFVPHRRKR